MGKVLNTTARVSCPDCGAHMILRRPRPDSKKQFDPFWGCSRFPDCRGSRNIDDEGEPIVDEIDEYDITLAEYGDEPEGE